MNVFSTTWKFELGVKVKDAVTGFKGITTARIEYLNGCLQYCVEPKVGKEGKVEKAQYVDEGQLEIQGAKKQKSGGIFSPSGGDMPNAPDKV